MAISIKSMTGTICIFFLFACVLSGCSSNEGDENLLYYYDGDNFATLSEEYSKSIIEICDKHEGYNRYELKLFNKETTVYGSMGIKLFTEPNVESPYYEIGYWFNGFCDLDGNWYVGNPSDDNADLLRTIITNTYGDSLNILACNSEDEIVLYRFYGYISVDASLSLDEIVANTFFKAEDGTNLIEGFEKYDYDVFAAYGEYCVQDLHDYFSIEETPEANTLSDLFALATGTPASRKLINTEIEYNGLKIKLVSCNEEQLSELSPVYLIYK